MNTEPTETTLADYARVIRRRRGFIVLVAIVCAAAALGVSALQTPSYEASASLTVRDENQDLTLLGGNSFGPQTPLQLAAIHVPRVTRQPVVNGVKRRLHSQLTTDALRNAIGVAIDPNSVLVVITAHARHGKDAADIANAFARVDAALTTRDARVGYARAARRLNKRLRALKASKDIVTQQIYLSQISRLQSLSSVAKPVELSQAAVVPSSPTSPKPVRNTLAALLFGLFLGVALAYGREAFDHRLRQASDVEQHFDEPVVGHIRSEALGHAGSFAGSGNDALGPLDPADEESFRILRQNVRYLAIDDEIRTVLVTSAMAQEGKSTVSAGLAMANATAGKRTLLIECDLRRPVLAGRFGLAEAPGLSDYLTGEAEPQDILQLVSAIPAANNGDGGSSLVCITAGSPVPRPADLLSSERFQAFLAQVSEAYEAVIVDSAPLLTVADTLEIVPHVGGLLVCMRLQQTTRDQARAARVALERLPDRPTGIVLTDVREVGDTYYGYYAAPAAAAKA